MYACPEQWVQRPNASHIHCNNFNCTETPKEKCCLMTGFCDSLRCNPNRVHKEESEKIPCQNTVCTVEKDEETCCQDAQTCVAFNCEPGSGFMPKPNISSLYCGLNGDEERRHCTDEDHEVCCGESGFCSVYPCPGGYLHIPNAHAV